MAEIIKPGIITASKHKPGQWKLLVPLVLVLVLLNVYGGDAETGDASAVASSESSADTSSPDGHNPVPARRDIPWPVVPLEFLLASNPFCTNARGSQEIVATDAQSGERPSGVFEGDDSPSADNSVESIARPVVDLATANLTAVIANPLVGRKVRMVFRSSRGTAAMIDDKVYHEGDRIENFEIARISRNGVTLRPTGETNVSGTANNDGH